MLKSIEGFYRQGKIELEELPANLSEETPVIVTFLEHSYWNNSECEPVLSRNNESEVIRYIKIQSGSIWQFL
jgi:hypothetical protein